MHGCFDGGRPGPKWSCVLFASLVIQLCPKLVVHCGMCQLLLVVRDGLDESVLQAKCRNLFVKFGKAANTGQKGVEGCFMAVFTADQRIRDGRVSCLSIWLLLPYVQEVNLWTCLQCRMLIIVSRV